PVRGAPDVKPVAASVTIAAGSALRPPAALETRTVVATRPPHDFSSKLRAQGLAPGRTAEPTVTTRIVPPPRSTRGTEPASTPSQPPASPQQPPSARSEPPASRGERQERGTRPPGQQRAAPTPPQPPASPQQPPSARSEPPASRGERQERGQQQERTDREERPEQRQGRPER